MDKIVCEECGEEIHCESCDRLRNKKERKISVSLEEAIVAIVTRINNYNRLLTELRGGVFVSESVYDIKSRYLRTKGVDCWDRMVKKELSRMVAERLGQGAGGY